MAAIFLVGIARFARLERPVRAAFSNAIPYVAIAF